MDRSRPDRFDLSTFVGTSRRSRRRTAWGAFAGVALLASALAVGPATAQWSTGGSVYSDDGIEITVDPRVISTFAILNTLGYNVESNKGPPPLYRPRFSEARKAARDAMGRPGRSVKRMAKVIKKNPVEAQMYAQAATKLGPSPKFLARDDAGKIEKGISKNLRAWYNEEGGAAVVRSVQSKVGDEQKKLLKPVNKTTAAIKKVVRLGDEEDQLLDDSGPSGRVIVSLNPLDTHGSMTTVVTPEVTTVIAGPLPASGASDALLGAVAFAFAKTLVGTEVRKAAKAPGTLLDDYAKLPKLLQTQMKDKAGFGTELMACAVVKVAAPKLPCVGSGAENPANKAVFDAVVARFELHAKTSDPFAGAAAAIFAPLAPAAPEPGEAPAEEGKPAVK